MKKELFSNMAIGEEKRLGMGLGSYYIIKRIDSEFFRVKLYSRYDEVLEKYRIPVTKIDEVFKLY